MPVTRRLATGTGSGPRGRYDVPLLRGVEDLRPSRHPQDRLPQQLGHQRSVPRVGQVARRRDEISDRSLDVSQPRKTLGAADVRPRIGRVPLRALSESIQRAPVVLVDHEPARLHQRPLEIHHGGLL